jgi:hypothetical protein
MTQDVANVTAKPLHCKEILYDRVSLTGRANRKQTKRNIMQNEIDNLKTLANEQYEIDGGEMLETFDAADYAELIAEFKTATAAWAWHLRITEARREAGGYYESF